MTASTRSTSAIPPSPTAFSIDERIQLALFRFFLFIVIAFSVPWFLLNPMNGDTAFFVDSGARILDGEKLYRDIVEPNAPPPYLFAAVSAGLGRLVGLNPETAFIVLLTLAVFFSLYRCYRVLREIYPSLPFAAPMLTLTAAYCFLPYANDQFGEREHIFMILVLPWLLGSALHSDERSRWEQIVDGMMATIGIAMKPYFLALYVCIQLLNLIVRARRSQVLRWDNLVIAVAQPVYAAAILFLFPDYRFVVRMALATYHNFRRPLPIVLIKPDMLLFFCAAALKLSYRLGRPLSGLRNLLLMALGSFILIILCVRSPQFYRDYNDLGFVALFFGMPLLCMAVVALSNRTARPVSELRKILLLASASIALVVLYQREGFPYHYYPLGVLVRLITTTILIDWIEVCNFRRARSLAFGFALFVTAHGVFYGTQHLELGQLAGPMLPLVRQEAGGKPILVFSTSLWAASPLINYTGTSPAWRFRSLWPLGGFYPDGRRANDPHPYRSRSQMNEFERYFIDSLIEDTRRHPPQLIIVEIGQAKEGFRSGKFDYLEYFEHDKRFARFFQDYDRLADVTKYRVYRRRFSSDVSPEFP